MEDIHAVSPRQSGKNYARLMSQIALVIEAFIFLLSLFPVQENDFIYGSVLDYWLSHMNSLFLVPVSLPVCRIVVEIIYGYRIFAFVCFWAAITAYVRKGYRATVIIALLPLVGFLLLAILEWVGYTPFP